MAQSDGTAKTPGAGNLAPRGEAVSGADQTPSESVAAQTPATDTTAPETAAEKPAAEGQSTPQVKVTAGPPPHLEALAMTSSDVAGTHIDPASTGSMNTVIAADSMVQSVRAAETRTDVEVNSAPIADAAVDEGQTVSSRRRREDGPEPAAALTSDRLLAKSSAPPVGGWRKALFTASFGRINVGDSDKVRLARTQDNLIASRLSGSTRYVPVLSRKGGVGKTTVTTLLGMVLADTREDRVIALDANPDRGTLSDRSPGRADFTARSLVRDRFNVTSFAKLADYVTRDGSRLDVLASDTDPAVAQAFDDGDYRAVTDILSKYYSIVLTDSGTGMVHSVMKGTLEKADAVVLVSGGSVDEARLASETLSWLEAHGRHDLVANAIVVINVAGGPTQVDVAQIEDHFKSRVRHVLRIPYDKHLAEGSRVELAKLRPATKAAVKELAALVVGELQRSNK